MPTKKNGSRAIPKLVWDTLAVAHLRIADELKKVIDEVDPEREFATFERLSELFQTHSKQAHACARCAANTKPGMPKKIPKNALTSPMKKPPGRPTNRGPKFDRGTYLLVERVRKDLKIPGTIKVSVKAAIDSLNKERAARVNRRVGSFVKDEYDRVRSSYYRGKRAVERDQNPNQLPALKLEF